ncbi:hypothetical protein METBISCDRAFT_14153 [Metschnikowia bicuspidata]|uniref:Zinc/iron permease n=1 Tax=Metschnikowia bicuspidata TaxID=27322 RepID=A0A4P9ZHH1_9ASCO|nr:hypothetical protein METBISCDRAFT_14153 [Metschnikowia bicuspidata]
MFINPQDFSQGWVLTTHLSLLCVLGCFIIFLDDLYYFLLPRAITSRYPFALKENYGFMNGSLAFSSGCLLLTALYRLLPEAMSYFEKGSGNPDARLVFSFIAGITICVLFNEGLHLLTTESVVHCSHGAENCSYSHGHAACSSDDSQDKCIHDISELTLLIKKSRETCTLEPVSTMLQRKQSLLHFFVGKSTTEEALLGRCKGYTSAELCHFEMTGGLHFCEIPQLRKSECPEDQRTSTDLERQQSEALCDAHLHHNPTEHHHHHVNSPLSRLMLIGVQTILAITLHKFPEGFITYITLKTNPQLGVSIFLSLLIHNYIEGFLMCLPLYYSFGESKWRKWKAVGISALLGGFSQPAGAFLGYLFINHLGQGNFDLGSLDGVFGVLMAMTAGFLSVIALQMYGSAVSFSGLSRFVFIWSLLGMCIIGVLTILTSQD